MGSANNSRTLTMNAHTFAGVLVPALTPFSRDLTPDAEQFIVHCRWLLEQGIDGLGVFGTTGEANSLAADERIRLVDALLDAGIPPERLMVGTGTCALTETARLTAHAVANGCAGVLVLPPFYYKAVSDDGLFASFAQTIERVGDARLRVYLYHIPPVAQVGISLDLVSRLIKAYPECVVGIKDSSGDWEHTQALLREFPGFATFAGSEVFLLDTLRGGGAGCITATGNVNPSGIRKVYEAWQTSDADRLQARITEIRQTIQAMPMIPALKSMVGACHGHGGWDHLRPPFIGLSPEQHTALFEGLHRIGFDMAHNRRCVEAAPARVASR